jgi:hypothetical protein
MANIEVFRVVGIQSEHTYAASTLPHESDDRRNADFIDRWVEFAKQCSDERMGVEMFNLDFTGEGDMWRP